MRQLSYKIVFLVLASVIIPVVSQAEEPGIYSRTIFAGKEPKLINSLFSDTVQKPAGYTKYLEYVPYYFKYYNDKKSIRFNKALSLNIVGLDSQDDKDPDQPIQGSNGSRGLNRTKKKPPLNAWRIAGEMLAGSAAGFIVSIPGGLIGIQVHGSSEEDPFGVLEGAIYGMFIGYTVGSAIGVYLVGSAGDETGSFLVTLGSSILGLAGGIAHMCYYDVDSAPLVFINPPIFATIAFNLTRKYESSSNSPTALINFEDDNMNYSVPIVYFKPDSYNGKLIYSMDLVRAKF